MGVSGSDVQLSPLARKSFSYDVECKSLARVGVYRYVDQCNNRGDAQPLVVVKENRRRPLAVVDAEHFFYLLRMVNGVNHNGENNETHDHTGHASEAGESN